MKISINSLCLSLLVACVGGQQWIDSGIRGHGIFLTAASPSRAAADVVWIPRGDDNVGFVASVSRDAARTFQDVDNSNGVMWLGIAADEQNVARSAIVTGLGAVMYTNDGLTFYNGMWNIISQYATSFTTARGSMFAAVGQAMFSDVNGVALSADGGQSFNFINVDVMDPMMHPVRYGAFPSESTWYISGGTWPSDSRLHPNGKTGARYHSLSSRMHLDRKTRNLTFVDPDMVQKINPVKAGERRCPAGTYCGAIAKTTDGGASWTLVYQIEGHYFNDIDCWDENNCVAAGEGGYDAGAFVTNDGGVSWTQTTSDVGRGEALMGVKYVGEGEVWVSGGSTTMPFEARFYKSTDNGHTWEKHSVPGLTGVSLDMSSPARGIAACLTPFGQSSFCTFQ